MAEQTESKKPWGYKNKDGRVFPYSPILEKQQTKLKLVEVETAPAAPKKAAK